MEAKKKWLAIIVEVEAYEGEVESVLPIEAETSDFFSKDELEAVIKYLKKDDDADFDFMWELRSVLISEADSDATPRREL